MKKAILFDLDGTLWDSSPQVLAAWNQCIKEELHRHEQFTLAQMHSYMGRTIEQIAAMMFPDVPEAVRCEYLDRCTKAEYAYLQHHAATLYPRSEQVIRALAEKYTLGIVSNCLEGYIPCYVAQCGFAECFTDFECAGHTGKPKGENIRLVVERNHITHCIYVGDTQGDADSAAFAGVKFVHAAYGFGTVTACDAALSAITELPEVAAKLL